MSKHWLLIGLIALSMAGCASGAKKAGHDKAGDEIKMSLEQAPAAVKATFAKEAGNGKIDSLVKEIEDGKMIYSADATIDGKQWEINVAEDGSLISKKLDKEEGADHKDVDKHKDADKDKDEDKGKDKD